MELYYVKTKKVKENIGYNKYEYKDTPSIATLQVSKFDFTANFEASDYKPWEKVGWEDTTITRINICNYCGNTCEAALYKEDGWKCPILFCSYKCASKALHINKTHSIRTNNRSHFINRIELRIKDKSICGICKNSVEMAQSSIDHIVPISAGGLHQWDNVQLAHYSCNMKRGNEELAKMSGGEKCVQGQYIYRAGKQFITPDNEDESETIYE